MSAAEDDTELRDLVVQSLEKNGVLGKIKAELRASIFLALDQDESLKIRYPLKNEKLQKYVSTGEGKLVASLVREFLHYFQMDYTLAVFDPEISADLFDRNELSKKLSIEDEIALATPLLSSLINGGNQKKIPLFDKVNIKSTKPDETITNVNESKAILNYDLKNNDDDDISSTSDPFFDDPIPPDGSGVFLNLIEKSTTNVPTSTSEIFTANKDSAKSLRPGILNSLPSSVKSGSDIQKNNKPSLTGGYSSSLQDLPPLTKPNGTKDPDVWKGYGDLDKKMEELGLNLYDDDSNKSASVSDKNEKPKEKTLVRTKSQESNKDGSVDQNTEGSIEEEIEADDLLNSIESVGDDTTVDQTISQASISGVADYVEKYP